MLDLEAIDGPKSCFHWPCSADKSLLASSGFQADVRALQKHLEARHLVNFSKPD